MLKEEQIKGLYAKIDIPQYSNEYLKYNNKKWKWEDKDFPRIPSLISFISIVQELQIEPKKMLMFNAASDPEIEYLKVGTIHNVNYIDDKDKNDMHTFNFFEKDYDFVMLNQTLEHLYNPFKALLNVYSHMKAGGYIYLNAPSNNKPHDIPNHFYTGFTATGLGALLIESGFEIIKLGQWGNIDYLIKIFKKGWTDYRENIWDNNKECPVICWALARKL